METGLVATDYLDSGATTAKAGVLIDLPRINYDANGENGSLLLEPSRANLVPYSEYLNSGIWNQSACSVTDNDATSPEGVTNAAKVEGDGTNNQIRLYDNYTFPSTGNYVLSVFAKAGNNDFIALAYKGVSGGITAYYNLTEGTTSDTTNGTIEAVGSDGWYRCTLKANLTGPDLTGNYNMYVARDLTTTTFPSNGDANGQYVHAYGFQVEASATYATSYIPNHGTTGGVTRAADSCSVTGVSDVIGQTEGTLFLDFNEDGNTNYSIARALSISDGTYNNRVYLSRLSSGAIYVAGSVGGSSVIELQEPTPSSRTRVKAALAYSNNDYVLYVNGVQKATDTSAGVPTCSNIYLGQEIGLTTNSLKKPYNEVILFNERLTNSELATLTTL